MMRCINYFIALFSLISMSALSQSTDLPSTKAADSASKMHTSSKVDMSQDLHKYLQMMDSIDSITLKSVGYRIQVFSSSGPNARKDALQSQSDFLKVYRDYPSYTKWNYPNWVVRLGDYRTHLEAMEFHNEITSLFPASFIVKDEINIRQK